MLTACGAAFDCRNARYGLCACMLSHPRSITLGVPQQSGNLLLGKVPVRLLRLLARPCARGRQLRQVVAGAEERCAD